MKKNNIKKGIFTALLLASPFVTAGTQYPAADFQPKVLYQDQSYQHAASESSGSSAKASFGEKSKADANYPAATFQPEVLYHDAKYKHNSSAASNKSAPLATWTEEAVTTTADDVSEAKADDSTMNPLFAIVVLGVAGFLFVKKSKDSKLASSRSAYSSGGLTGVAKYLESKVPKLSGVAKYLELNQPAPKSGVAKYVARKVVAEKKAASEKTTGVEKYVRNKG